MGLAAAWSLRHRRHSVVVYDPNPPGSGMSAGLVRGFRLAHPTTSSVRLAQRALAGWRVWERQFDRPLLDTQGVLVTGAEITGWPRAMKAAGADFALLDERARRSAFGCNGGIPGTVALYDPAAAAIDAAGVISALVEALTASDGDVLREQVTGIESRADGLRHRVRVYSDHSVRDFDHVFVCAGPASGRLVAHGLPLPAPDPAPHSYALAQASADSRRAPAPMWLHYVGKERYTWLHPTGIGSVAIGANWSTCDPDDTECGRFEDAQQYIERHVPFVSDPQPVAAMVASVSLPAGSAFALSSQGGITTVVGNQTFRFAPLIGRLLADHVDDEAPLLPRGVPALEKAARTSLP